MVLILSTMMITTMVVNSKSPALFGIPYLTQTQASQDISVTINSVPVSFDVKPVIIESRTMVPLRAIFEALGAQVTWDGETKTIYGSKGSTIIILQIANLKAFVNSNVVELDVAPQIIDGRTLVPTRFIAESLSAKVDWDDQTSTVIITTTDEAPTPTAEPIATPIVDAVKSFNATTLAAFNGQNGNPAYIAVNGNVYDVTSSDRWRGGSHKGYPAGVDYTNEFARQHNLSMLNGFEIVGKYTK
jgi:predicted heme/steroid binding protein